MLFVLGILPSALVGLALIPWWTAVAPGVVAGAAFAFICAPADNEQWWS